jgi:hypothetical protein
MEKKELPRVRGRIDSVHPDYLRLEFSRANGRTSPRRPAKRRRRRCSDHVYLYFNLDLTGFSSEDILRYLEPPTTEGLTAAIALEAPGMLGM